MQLPSLVSDVLGEQRSRPIDVVGALDDRPAIGEHVELIAVGMESQKKAIVLHLAERLQVPGQLLEVEPRRTALRHLHGVAPPQRLVVCEPYAPSNHSNLPCKQQGQSTLPRKGPILIRFCVFSHTSI